MASELPYRIYERLPEDVKAFIRPVARAYFSFKAAFSLASQIRLSAYLLHGREKRSGNNLTTLFFGEGMGVRYLSSLLYSEEPLRESLGKVFIWRIKSRLKLDLFRADLIFIKVDGFFSRFLSWQGFMIIPEWTLFMMDLSKPFPEAWNLLKNKSLRENLREMRKHSYSCEMTHDLAKFEYFYSQMYLPYVSGRFGELTVVTRFQEMEKIFKKGLLFLVRNGNDYVSGNILTMNGDTVFFLYLGITEGKIEYLKKGALTALYYFNILWAKEKGYKWIDYGHCRSFLKDGIFNYKKRWGMEIQISRRYRNIFGTKIYNFHHGVQSFLERNPFVFIDLEKLKGLVLVGEDHPVTLEEVQSLVKTYSIPGLDSLIILSDQGFTQHAEEYSCSNREVHLIITKPYIFFEAYPHVLHSGKT